MERPRLFPNPNAAHSFWLGTAGNRERTRFCKDGKSLAPRLRRRASPILPLAWFGEINLKVPGFWVCARIWVKLWLPSVMNAIIEIPVLPPRSLVVDPPLSDDEFELLSELSQSAILERSKEGTIIVNAPAGGMTSDGNREITEQLSRWWKTHRRGRALDSSAGFFLPDGSMLSPDAAYVTAEQLQGLTRDDLARFLHLAPAFVIELRSKSDRLPPAEEKMESWIANGVQRAWLIDPYSRRVHVYQPGAAPPIESEERIEGSGPVQGFVLDLEEVWRCFE
jgi:Uma2 family endonuclease